MLLIPALFIFWVETPLFQTWKINAFFELIFFIAIAGFLVNLLEAFVLNAIFSIFPGYARTISDQ